MDGQVIWAKSGAFGQDSVELKIIYIAAPSWFPKDSFARRASRRGEEGVEAKIMNANPSPKNVHGTTTRCNRKAHDISKQVSILAFRSKNLGKKKNKNKRL
ncbi:hypothetical protein PGT21_001333 [Puccinia graminis f. sp. tritici]|uniref:Uncharacterized protein n=1 Tax=Puccinia graminis f. sp. tritici TaxID=56615 RepID=A0A5B0QE28_PUCGR|nr:hypothetical protein PGT21_001333 [Puccinia graminis f. sp. tritici]